MQALVCGQVGGDDAQQVVGVTEEPLGLDDLRDACDSFLEAQEGLAIFLAHGDEDERLERQAEGVGVHDGAVAAYRAATFQLPQSAVTGGDAQADTCRQLGDAQAAVLLERGKDFAVDSIHGVDYSTISSLAKNTWEHFRAARG